MMSGRYKNCKSEEIKFDSNTKYNGLANAIASYLSVDTKLKSWILSILLG